MKQKKKFKKKVAKKTAKFFVIIGDDWGEIEKFGDKKSAQEFIKHRIEEDRNIDLTLIEGKELEFEIINEVRFK